MRLRRGEGRLLVLLLIAYGWLFVFFERLNNPNELVRVYAARALAEQGTWSIGTREIQPGRVVDGGPVYSDWGYVNDKALTCDDPRAQPPACAGRLFAAKAPAASLLGAPVLAAMRIFGNESARLRLEVTPRIKTTGSSARATARTTPPASLRSPR